MKGRGASLLELAVVAVVIAVLASLLLQRLTGLQSESWRVVLRMGAQSVLSAARQLELRCPRLEDLECQRRLLGSARLPRNEGPLGRLYAIASIAGLTQHPDMRPHWVLRELDGLRLELGLANVTDCRFVLRWEHETRSAKVEDVSELC